MKSKKITRETIAHMDVVERNFPQFQVGDAIEVSQRVIEGEKERLQAFEGDVIAMSNNGISSTFTVRRIGANGISVEKIFPYYSPVVESIKLLRKGDVRRAKLYYMRHRIGKAARVKELVLSKTGKKQNASV
ncbi:MAG: 50S ribosomal protein L19 [candidate division TM6 bacterium GW2011_GWE2_41_16]|nr:MAG: 50S ribosomal protein L19 [candidate division TM6 bacterium GW2011_GWE2_41_16]